jgi:membrane protease YdiL (CAAX protease family)
MLKNLWNKIITTIDDDNAQSAIIIPKPDKKHLSILLYIPFCLTMIYYVSHYYFLRIGLSNIGADRIIGIMDKWIRDSFTNNLGELTYWVFTLVVFYFIIPIMMIKFYFKENISDYGLKIKGALNGYYLYIIMLLVMIPLVLYFSTTAGFQAKYPFLKVTKGDALFPELLKWELLYCTQFFVLEFFFRGFVVFGLKPQLGLYSIFIMTIPYCMIHFGKPLPEALAAIIAGVVLGFLSMKNKSIWLGFLIHCSVGVGMDMASLWQKGMFR